MATPSIPNIPNVEAASYENILGALIAAYVQKTNINDLTVGSISLSLLEAVALSVARSSGDIFQIERDLSVDRAVGEALQRIAFDQGLQPIPAQAAFGTVTFIDTTFEKVSAKIYAGTNAPVIGTNVLNISTATGFTVSGSVIVGRGTPNVEQLSYSSITNNGSYFTLNLTSPTTQYHNINETVILSQGGARSIPVNTVVSVPALGINPQVNFNTTTSAVILDGETEVQNVPVLCAEVGSIGNVSIGTISQLSVPPFSGATVSNPLPFTTGKDPETDEQLRIRIKRARLSTGLGTANAITASVIGAAPKDEPKTVQSSSLGVNQNNDTILYVDDGSGYEPKTQGVGVEPIVDNAFGGETNFQLQTGGNQANVAKAFLLSVNQTPLDVIGGDVLAITVGNTTTQHQFQASDFISQGAVSAYEVSASINNNPTLNWEASTEGGGAFVRIQAKTNVNENIQVATPQGGRDAALQLQLPSSKEQTLRLYKNKQLLSKDGEVALIRSQNQSQWDPSIATGDTLIISVDNTGFNTYTFTDADFIAEGTYPTVASTNSLQSWVNVINAKVTGVTAQVDGDQISLVSNRGRSDQASLDISTTSTLVVKAMFTQAEGLSALGQTSDYTFSPNTAQIRLDSPLLAGDELSAGLEETEARLASDLFNSPNVTILSDTFLWVLADDKSYVRRNLGTTSGSTLTVSLIGNEVTYTSSVANAFASVQAGDYVVIHGSVTGSISGSNQGNFLEGRIQAKTNNSFTLLVTATEAANITPETVPFAGGLDIFGCDKTPQKLFVDAGVKTLNQIAAELTLQTESLVFGTIDNNQLFMQTRTRDSTGSVVITVATAEALILQLPLYQIDESKPSQVAFYESGYIEGQFPSFVNLIAQADSEGNPYAEPILNPLSNITATIPSTEDPNKTIVSIEPLTQSLPLAADTTDQDSAQKDEVAEITVVNPTDFDLKPNRFYRRIRNAIDRVSLREPLSISADDNLNVILNKDSANQLFSFNLFRRLLTSSTFGVNTTQFNALDQDNGSPPKPFGFAALPQDDGFFTTFDFENFAILMQAKKSVLGDVAGNETALLIRSNEWGRSGERVRYGYFYPEAPNQALTFAVEQNDLTNVKIFLQSGVARTPSIQASTLWDVSVSVGVVDDVTYTWDGISPDPSPTLATLVIGDYVNVSTQSGFDPANQGVFKVKSFTATSFTVERPTGVAVAELGAPTGVVNGILFYAYTNTTAADVQTFITSSNLSNLITATLVDDGGTTGAGTIELSTARLNAFAFDYEDLLDGINWIQTYDPLFVGPNFTLKLPLQLASDTGYEFQDGEECRIVPTTIAQLVRFLNVPAVASLSLAGTIDVADRAGRLQFATNLVGSDGAIQIVGGPGNTLQAVVNASASLIYTPLTASFDGYSQIFVSEPSLVGLISDQYLKVQAATAQAKETTFDSAGTVEIDSNQPSAGLSTFTVNTNLIGQRYFGTPKNFTRTEGRIFKVEKQGLFTAISWNQVGTPPDFQKQLEINAAAGNYSIVDTGGGIAQLTILSGNTNFKEVSIGDLLVLNGTSDNDGGFLVTGVSPNGTQIQYLNSNVVAEAGAALSSFFEAYGQVQEGDTVILKSPFNILNQGTFRVIRATQNEFWIDNPQSVDETIEDSLNSIAIGYNGSTVFDLVKANGEMTLEIASGAGSLEDIRAGDIITFAGFPFLGNNVGSFMVKGIDLTTEIITFVNCTGATATGVTGVAGGDLQVHRPSLVFYDYEATVPNDKLLITSNFLGSANQAQWTISEVLSENQVIISGVMTDTVAPVPLGLNQPNVLVMEQTPYVGYKKIRQKYTDPNSNGNGIIVFDSYQQYKKISSQAQTTISPMNKLEFSTQVNVGLDAYSYYEGLIGESNRIVYGSAQDPATYPGVAAAGAEIYIREPLVRRIQVGIEVRIATGVPFLQIVQQVRQNVAALINSNPIGQPIAISNIVSVVDVISGVKAVAISSPLYSPLNDTINIGPAEKAKILNPVTDILVSEIVS